MGENLIESFRKELPTFFKAAKEYFDGELPKKVVLDAMHREKTTNVC